MRIRKMHTKCPIKNCCGSKTPKISILCIKLKFHVYQTITKLKKGGNVANLK